MQIGTGTRANPHPGSLADPPWRPPAKVSNQHSHWNPHDTQLTTGTLWKIPRPHPGNWNCAHLALRFYEVSAVGTRFVWPVSLICNHAGSTQHEYASFRDSTPSPDRCVKKRDHQASSAFRYRPVWAWVPRGSSCYNHLIRLRFP